MWWVKMKTNLIQTYMNNQINPDRNLDIKYELSNRTFIKPLPASGKLVKNGVFVAPSLWAKDVEYDFKSFHDTLRGKGNDHELGKINDIGMKLGGLAIAGYLMTRKNTPLKKAMELVGLASFFGAMSLWPKIALQIPARLIHGFNIRQEYEDSYGRKKMFFQDPQYLPWDLIDDEKINKIGDRMNVPKDIPNRRDFIQEKMKKIAIQNNTLWMLTAGFATPVLSALICNLSEKPIVSLIDKYRSWQADKLLDNIGTAYKNYIQPDTELAQLIETNKGKALTPELAEKIKARLVMGIDGVTAESVKYDLDGILGMVKPNFAVNDVVKENLKQALQECKMPASDGVMQVLDSYAGRKLGEADMQKLLYDVYKEVKIEMKRQGLTNIQEIFAPVMKTSDNPVSRALRSNPTAVMTDELAEQLGNISKYLTKFRARNSVLDRYIYLKAGSAPETGIANAWNEITGKLPKIFDLSDKEIKAIRHDKKFAGKLFREKLEAITSDKAKYEQVIRELADGISKMDAKIVDLEVSSEGSYMNAVDSTFNHYAEKLRNSGMYKTADSLVGKDGQVMGSLKHIQKSYIKNRLIGVRSSMYRLLNTLDFFRRVSTVQNLDALGWDVPKEVKEEVIELAKRMSIEGSTSDFMTKFFMLRNPKPRYGANNQVKLDEQAGKILYEFLDKPVEGGRVDLPNDRKFYQSVMNLLYGNNSMHAETKNLLAQYSLRDGIERYRADFLHEIGNSEYFTKPAHIVGEYANDVSSYTKFLRMGMSPDQMLHHVVKERYNTKTWLKMFGGFGAALLGVTVLAQFFFGKMKNPERIKND